MLNNPRLLNLLGFGVCAGLIAFALYVQHGLGFDPCPLCIFQRVAIISVGALFGLAALQGPGPGGRRIYGVLVAVAAGIGTGVAGRHLWLQSLPPERVPACGPGLDYMLQSFPFMEMLRTVLSGSGECAEVNWQFLGLAMPGWVLLWALALGLFGVWNNWRRLPASD